MEDKTPNMKNKLAVQLLFVSVLFLLPFYIHAQTPWNATDWVEYDTVTIKHENIDDDLLNFPVYVDLHDLSSRFWNITPTSSSLTATDIRITTDEVSPTELPREIVSANFNDRSGELYFKAPNISSTTNTVFRIYYNGTTTGDYATTSSNGAQNVWSSNYLSVYHDGGGTDSTNYNRTATASGTPTVGGADGAIGSSTNLNGSNQAFFADDVTGINGASAITTSMWINSDLDTQDRPIYTFNTEAYDHFGDWYTGLRFDSVGNRAGASKLLKGSIRNTSGSYTDIETASNDAVKNEWMLLHQTWDSSTNSIFDIYKNGVSTINTATATAITGSITANVLAIGRGNKVGWWDGKIDEFRVASTSFSDAWIKAEYLNQSTTTDFYTVDINTNIPHWNPTNWQEYEVITIDSVFIDDDIYSLPVYVDLSHLSDNFWSMTPSGSSTVGTDIRITTDELNPVELAYDLVWASSTAKQGELYFKADYVSSSTDTSFRIYYNGSTTVKYHPSDTYGAEAVWSDYIVVWHMNSNTRQIDSSGNLSDYLPGTGFTRPTLNSDGNIVMDSNDDFAHNSIQKYFKNWTSFSYWDPNNNNSTDAQVNPKNAGFSLFEVANINTNLQTVRVRSGGASRSTVSGPRSSTTPQTLTITYDDNNQKISIYSNGEYRSSTLTANTPSKKWDGWRVYRLQGINYESRGATKTFSPAYIKAVAKNYASTSSFYATSTASVGYLTLSDHSQAQVKDAFNSTNKTNEELFAFKLTPSIENASTTNIVFSISNANNIDTNKFSNFRIVFDSNNDKKFNTGDIVKVTGGVMSIDSNHSGTITFTNPFIVSSTTNLLLVADWDSPRRRAQMSLSLSPDDITAYGVSSAVQISVSGSVNDAYHRRTKFYGGGSSSSIGGDNSQGNSVETGGGSEAGEQIGNDPDFHAPGSHSGSWNNGQNAYDTIDATYATTSSNTSIVFSNFNLSIPNSNSIEGIETKIEFSGSTNAGTVSIDLSWDAGSSWTTAKTTATATTVDSVEILGALNDLWGRIWTASEFSNTNFRVRATANTSSNELKVDEIRVKVHNIENGGGNGGGGSI